MFPWLEPLVFNTEDIAEYLDFFNQQGYAVINIDDIDPVRIKNLFIGDMLEINPDLFSRTSNIWDLKEGQDYPKSRMQGLLGEYGLSQGSSAWTVRLSSDIQNIFCRILNSSGPSDIVCSSDAIGFSTNHEQPTNRVWLHTDQNPDIPYGDILSVQGIYYAEDVPEDGATTVIVPGSHLEVIRSASGTHFNMTNPLDYSDGAFKLQMKAGQLLVFNSRLVHQGWHGTHRLCFMLSYGKKEDRTEKVRRNKVLMYLCGHRSTHWSQLGQLHGYKYLQYGWNAVKPRLRKKIHLNPDQELINMFDSDLYDIGMEWYNSDLDEYVPTDILTLL